MRAHERLADAAVAAREHALDVGLFGRLDVDDNVLAPAQRLLEALQALLDDLAVRHRLPLERRERLRDEGIDGERQRALAAARFHVVLEPLS